MISTSNKDVHHMDVIGFLRYHSTIVATIEFLTVQRDVGSYE